MANPLRGVRISQEPLLRALLLQRSGSYLLAPLLLLLFVLGASAPAPAQSGLRTVITNMPSANHVWAPLTTLPVNKLRPTNILLDDKTGTTSCCPLTGTWLSYANNGAWNRITKQLFFIGGDHSDTSVGCTTGCDGFVMYDETTNMWSKMPYPSWATHYAGIHQSYNQNAHDDDVNFYFWDHQTWSTQLSHLFRFNSAAGTWKDLGQAPHDQLTGIFGFGLAFFPGMTGPATRGAALIAVSTVAPYADIWKWDIAKSSWKVICRGHSSVPLGPPYDRKHRCPRNGGGTSNTAIYSAGSKGVIVLGNGSDKPFRIERDGTMNILPKSLPWAIDNEKAKVAADPLTGDLIFAVPNNKLWKLDVDPTSTTYGTLTDITSASCEPTCGTGGGSYGGTGTPTPANDNMHCGSGAAACGPGSTIWNQGVQGEAVEMILTPLDNYRIIMATKCFGSANQLSGSQYCEDYVYRHHPSGTVSVAPVFGSHQSRSRLAPPPPSGAAGSPQSRP